jgi:ABC-type sugar transport system ATPase subunit
MPFAETRGVAKAFGGVQALRDVSMAFAPGEIHGLVGANGAGKSTLVRILAGVHQPDAGEIIIEGKPAVIPNTMAARELGMSFIHQELNLVPKFTVLQSLGLGLEKPGRLGFTDWRSFRAVVEPIAERLHFRFGLDELIEDLSVADRWMVSIGHALIHRSRLVAMDEPTASLSPDEVEQLFGIITELRDDGVAILYVSHRLDEIERLCDRVSIFRDGHHVATLPGSDVSRQALIEGIIGGPAPTPEHAVSASAEPLEPVLEVEDLQLPPNVNGVSFSVGRGEVVGLAGLVGAGRTESARIVFGADRAVSGRVRLEGREIMPRSPREASKLGIALVPEERRSQGLLLQEPVRFNLTLASLDLFRARSRLPFVNLSRARHSSREMVERLDIRTPGVEEETGKLSGGNQQKVVVGKWLMRQPKLLILDEPTRGVDVGARAEIHRTIRRQAEAGVPILMIASELEELLGCDRVLVMREGKIVGALTGPSITVPAMLALSYGDTPTAA